MEYVLVKWLDAQDHKDIWADAEDVNQWAEKPCEIISIGFLVRKTEKYITIAGDYDDDDKDWGRVTKIPTAWLVSVEPLKP